MSSNAVSIEKILARVTVPSELQLLSTSVQTRFCHVGEFNIDFGRFAGSVCGLLCQHWRSVALGKHTDAEFSLLDV